MKAFNHSNKLALVAVAMLGATVFAAGAQADEMPMGVGSRAVRYSDLNLNTEAGAKVLYRRIYAAAAQVCGDPFSRQLDQAAATRTCMDKAISASVQAVNRTQLTRAANAHGYALEDNISVASVR